MQQTERLKLFAEVSAILTGFNVMELWGTGMMETYFEWIEKKADKQDLVYFYEAIEQIFAAHKNEQARESAVASIIFPASAYHGLAQQLITLWYMGNWNETITPEGGGAPKQVTIIPTPEAYEQGLAWIAGQTHPPAAKQPGYA